MGKKILTFADFEIEKNTAVKVVFLFKGCRY